MKFNKANMNGLRGKGQKKSGTRNAVNEKPRKNLGNLRKALFLVFRSPFEIKKRNEIHRLDSAHSSSSPHTFVEAKKAEKSYFVRNLSHLR